jgi:S-DNA-T family DNA segregation ATPase FtsK/SpoIIIE
MAQALRFFGPANAGDSAARAILPAGAKRFLVGGLMQVAGFAIAAAALLAALALFSYAPSDPSLNNASDAAVSNLLGPWGAITADLLIQVFGLAGYVPLIGFGVWGTRLLARRPIANAYWRALALILAGIAAAVSLSALPSLAQWPLATGMGGVTGQLVFGRAEAALMAADIGAAAPIIAAVMVLVAMALWIYGVGLSQGEWRTLARGLGIGWGVLGTGMRKSRAAFSVVPAWRNWLPGHAGIEPTLRRGRPEPDDADLDDEDEEGGFSVRVSLGKGDDDEIDDEVPEPAAKSRSGLVEPQKPKPKTGRKAAQSRQGKLALEPDGAYAMPPLDLLEAPDESAAKQAHNKDTLEQNAKFLGTVLEDFGVKGEIVKVRPGPVVTLYELEPAPGTKTSRVIGLSDDIARSMSAVSVRVAVVPGRNVIGIELPIIDREMVLLRELLASQDFEKSKASLPLALGKDIGGAPVTADLARMPHLLIAGTTGSGKSVAMNTMILSLLYSLDPNQCKLIMIDPKMLELSVYEGIPHLLTPVVTDPSKAVVALKWAVREMEDRYRAMSQLGVRNISGYNARLKEAVKKGEELTRRVQTGFDDDGKPVFEEQPLPTDPLPFIVVVVDEMADLMLVAGKDVEAAIQRLAQMARAAGIHLIMATQRPSVDVITGTVKANFPTRISFQVTSKIDSRTILGEQGAEQLLGQGDMLYMAGGGRITRVHGPFVSDHEVEHIVEHLKAQGEPEYIEEVTTDDEPILGGSGGGGSDADALYDEAVALVAREGKASTSFIQRHLQIGYNRAARIIEQMEKEGVVSPANRVGRREVLVGSH